MVTVIQKFLGRCYKRHYISEKTGVCELLQKADIKLYNKRVLDKDHPRLTLYYLKKSRLVTILEKKISSYVINPNVVL